MQSFNKLSFIKSINFLLFLYPALVFMPFAYSNITFGVLISLFFFGIIFKKIELKSVKPYLKWYGFIIIPFLLTLISALQSHNWERGLEFVYNRLPILIYPFIYFTLQPDEKTTLNGFKLLIVSSFLAVLYSWENYTLRFPDTFYLLQPEQIQKITIIQHPYVGMFALLSFILLIENLHRYHFPKTINFILATVLLSGVVLSTSRLAMILTVFYGFYLLFNRFDNRMKWIGSGVLVLGISIFMMLQPAVKQKFTNEFTFEKSPRLLLWNNAVQLIKNNDAPFGIGIGDFYTKKIDTYWFLGDYLKYKQNFKGLYGYECHNLYLEFLLLNGVLGIFFTMAVLYLLYIVWKNANRTNLIIFLLLASFMFTETLLLRQWGVIFYGFIGSITALPNNYSFFNNTNNKLVGKTQ